MKKVIKKLCFLWTSAAFFYTCLALLLMLRNRTDSRGILRVMKQVAPPGEPRLYPGLSALEGAAVKRSTVVESSQVAREDHDPVSGTQVEKKKQQEEDKGGGQKEVQQEEDKGGGQKEVQQEEDNGRRQKEVQQEEDSGGRQKEIQQEEDSGGRQKKVQQEEDNGSQQKEDLDAPGAPLMVLLLSSMPRSGSTLLTEILSVPEESIVFFEPLWLLEKGKWIEDAQYVVKYLADVFTCAYKPDFEKWLKTKHLFLNFFNAKAKKCLAASDKEVKDPCVHDLSLRDMCLTSPVRIIKVIRTRLSWMEDLLTNPLLNVKLIHLARDPRASLTSIRRFKNWNKNPYDRCVGLEEDFKAYDELSFRYPSKVLQIHYEDLCLNPQDSTSSVYNFLYGSSRVPEVVKKYIASHMKGGSRNENMSTFKNSSKEYEAWRFKIPPGLLKSVEEEPTCLRSIQYMRHTEFKTLTNVRNKSIPLFQPD
ncbi:carbohydrate sulfotransferase 3-like [Panulirus ornatus]|uniref:carbohydrate sulfotransferase 3-like n=1 Tax=Panulirus ornatus TaxID=150431 RepID=UPI003A8BA802